MLQRLHARLSRIREAEEGEAAIGVEVRVERRDGVSHGTVALVGEDERTERTASSPSCERVLTALAIMAAVGLDEGIAPVPAASPDAGPAEGPAVEPEPPPVAPSPRPSGLTKTATPPSPRHATHVGVAIGTSFEISANRAAIVMPGVFAQLVFPVRFEPLLRLGFARSFRDEVASARGSAGLAWTEATVAGCGDLFGNATIHAGPCVNAEGGVLQAIVNEPLPSRGRTRPWFSAGASARLAWRPLSALSFEIVGGVRVPLIRNELFFEPLSLVYEAPAVVPFVGTAVAAHLP
ncbi:hypothetical protein AKJ09_04003 [Labilithrix luteola]|uniref:Uncharacterized protein n=1 Tax=Labilithrix luteola TaxID=1391654 RepID=A0A0K1PW20_9BACT|nr:hypothetical protein [Labilithrix luteola]AKU97339.1 hypothetical protein AKJ09_04003 [Labilithrix luteola]